jgi:hypothetical protein
MPFSCDVEARVRGSLRARADSYHSAKFFPKGKGISASGLADAERARAVAGIAETGLTFESGARRDTRKGNCP